MTGNFPYLNGVESMLYYVQKFLKAERLHLVFVTPFDHPILMVPQGPHIFPLCTVRFFIQISIISCYVVANV